MRVSEADTERGGLLEPEQRFTALWQAHHAAVLRYAVRRTDTSAAQDVVSEAFLVAWRRLAEVPDDPAQSLPWLYGVARRALANSDRSRRRAQRLSAQLSRAGTEETLVADPADGVTEQARVQQALGSLAEHDQEILRLIGWEGLDLAGAALAMGSSRATTAVRLHRARSRMARALGALDAENGEAGTPARTTPDGQLCVADRNLR
jgi:RNA polymerase sigma-70 factor (ECF subfamily)